MKGAYKFINVQLDVRFDRLADYLTFLFFKEDALSKIKRETGTLRTFLFSIIKLSPIKVKLNREEDPREKERREKEKEN